jgi:hypothetical protein
MASRVSVNLLSVCSGFDVSHYLVRDFESHTTDVEALLILRAIIRIY